jgi:hypothetical protein
MKDPDSAQFRDEVLGKIIGPVYCGQVNARNGYGGYAGFTRVMAGFDLSGAYVFSETYDSLLTIGGPSGSTLKMQINTEGLTRETADIIAKRPEKSERYYKEIAYAKIFEQQWNKCMQ